MRTNEPLHYFVMFSSFLVVFCFRFELPELVTREIFSRKDS